MKTNRPYLLLFVAVLKMNLLFAQTTVTGNIYTSTTWTAAESPYIIANNIVLFAGATLTVEPGVTVIFNDGITFDFRGKLIANGTAAKRIFFTSSKTSPAAGDYIGLKVTGYINTSASITNQITMTYCNVSYAANFLHLANSCEGPFYIRHCCFHNNKAGIGNSPNCGDTYIDSCKFDSNYMGVEQNYNGEVYVSNCLFVNNNTGTTAYHVSNSTFTGNKVGVFAYTSLENCEIYGNETGAQCDVHGGSYVHNNYIHDNNTGVQINRIAGGKFIQNKICNNSTWNIDYTGRPYNSDASFNCFCTSDSAAIRSKIKDGYVDPSLGLLTYNVYENCYAGVITGLTPTDKPVNMVKVYPNPFSYSATFDFKYIEGDIYSIIITDPLGRVVTVLGNIRSGSVRIHKDGLASGIYYYQLWNGSSLENTGKLAID